MGVKARTHVVLTTGIVVAALALAPAAEAKTTGGGNMQFLDIFHTHVWGVTFTGGDSTLIDLGHAICNSLDGSGGQRAHIQQILANKWRDESDAAWTITAAAVALCPEHIVSSDRW